ncbi:hypothetical protein [Streptomyces sp. NPDC026589]
MRQPVVKANHPGLHTKVKKLPWRDIPLGDRAVAIYLLPVQANAYR